MSQDTTIEYKLRLAHDLILFLTSSYLQRVPQEQKAEGVNTILQSWEERVEANVRINHFARKNNYNLHSAQCSKKGTPRI